MLKHLSLVFLCTLGFAITAKSDVTRTLVTNSTASYIAPSALNLQPKTYAVFNIQFPGGTTTWSDFELKGSITNFDNEKWFDSRFGSGYLPPDYNTYKDKTQWNALTNAQRNSWLNNSVFPTYRPSWWVDSTTNVKEILKKDAYVQANTGPYIFFFSTMLTYDTHYKYGKNDGAIKVWFTVPSLKGDITVDGRHWIKYFVPTTASVPTISTVMYDSRSTQVMFEDYIDASGGIVRRKVPTFNEANQKLFSIGNLYSFASYTGATSMYKGPATNAVVIVVYYEPWPVEGSAEETALLNDTSILWSDKVYRYVMTKFCKPTNPKLQWCTIFSNRNGFEQKVAVGSKTTGSYGESSSFIFTRVYRPAKPSEWVSRDTAQNMDNILNTSSQNNF